ncbi:MAG: hypothetical protein ABI242_08045, partial [Caulobacteraceae bacterium]
TLGKEVKTRRTDLATQRAARRVKLDIAHRQEVEEAIEFTFLGAFREDFPDFKEGEIENLFVDLQEILWDGDEFKGYLDRPVGETVAKLCAAMGLDPALCRLDGETWKARREPYAFETARRAKAAPPAAPCPAPSLAAAATGPPG